MAPTKTKKKAKKAARKPAKKQARQSMKRAPVKAKSAKATRKPKAKARTAAKPLKKKMASAVRARKATAMPKRKVMARKAPARASAPKAAVKPVKAPAAPRRMAVPPPPTLQRERRRLPEAEAEMFTEANGDSRLMSSARAGHDELRSEIQKHTESGPEMTAGDVDAKWQDAYALGDEAPGGDNMTPDQGRVDDIGKALGIEYADDEELLGGDELIERDEHRWELNPASKDEDEDDR